MFLRLGLLVIAVFLIGCITNPQNTLDNPDGPDQERPDDLVTIEEPPIITKVDTSAYDTEVIISKWVDTAQKTDGFVVISIDSIDTMLGENNVRMFFDFSEQILLSEIKIMESLRLDKRQAVKEDIVEFRKKLVAVRRTVCIMAELIIFCPATSYRDTLFFDLRKSSVHSTVIPKGLYDLEGWLSHGIEVDWFTSGIREVAFYTESTFDCRKANVDTVNLTFTEKTSMVIFAKLPSPPGHYTNGKQYKVAAKAPAGMQYVSYENDTLYVWCWADIQERFAQLNLEDDSTAKTGLSVELSFFWDITDFDKFKDTWIVEVPNGGVAFGTIKFSHETPLVLDSIRYRPYFSTTSAGEHVKLYFNKTQLVISPLAWEVRKLGSADTIHAQMNEYYSNGVGGALIWFPTDLGFHFVSGDKFIFDLQAIDPYGFVCTVLDTLTIP